MERINADATRFTREIRHGIPCRIKGKQHLMNQIKNNVLSYARDNPDSDYKSIIGRFGTPEQIITSYIAELDESDVIRQIRASKRIVSIAVVTAALILLSWVATVYSAMSNHINNEGGYIVEELIDEGPAPSEKGEYYETIN